VKVKIKKRTLIERIIRYKISIFSILEGSFAAASVLISFGAILGKTNLFQLLFLTVIETILYVANGLVGRHVFGAVDIGNKNASTYGIRGKSYML